MASEKQMLMKNFISSNKQRGFIDTSRDYRGSAFSVDQEEIEKHPTWYIIKECLPACKILWSKNIFTYATSDYEDQDTYIEIEVENLSTENIDVITSLKEPYFKRNGQHNSIIIGVNGVGVKAQRKLMKLANLFVLQDIPENKLYVTREEALIKCGYYNTIPNPNYIDPIEFKEMIKGLSDVDSLIASINYERSSSSKKTIPVFDPTNITEQTKYEIAKKGYILDENKGCYYHNNNYYARHIAFLEEKNKHNARNSQSLLLQERKIK